jgi:hypothetical protein
MNIQTDWPNIVQAIAEIVSAIALIFLCCSSDRTGISPGLSGARITRTYISRDCRSTVCRDNVSKKYRKYALLRQYPEENQSDYRPAFVELLRRGKEGARNVNS